MSHLLPVLAASQETYLLYLFCLIGFDQNCRASGCSTGAVGAWMMSAVIRAEEDCLKPLGEVAGNLQCVFPLV